jgi:hypothetical protein
MMQIYNPLPLAKKPFRQSSKKEERAIAVFSLKLKSDFYDFYSA